MRRRRRLRGREAQAASLMPFHPAPSRASIDRIAAIKLRETDTQLDDESATTDGDEDDIRRRRRDRRRRRTMTDNCDRRRSPMATYDDATTDVDVRRQCT